MALWDAVSKAEGVPLWRLLADRYNAGVAGKTAWVYAAGGVLLSRQGYFRRLRDEMKRYLDLDCSTVKDEDRRRAVQGRHQAHRSGAESRRRQEREFVRRRRTAASISTRRSPAAMPSRRIICAGTRSRSTRSIICCMRPWRRAMRPPLATGENLFSMQDARNLIRHGGLRADGIGCNSIRPCPMGWSNICERSTCWPRTAGRGGAAYRMAGISSR